MVSGEKQLLNVIETLYTIINDQLVLYLKTNNKYTYSPNRALLVSHGQKNLYVMYYGFKLITPALVNYFLYYLSFNALELSRLP